MASPLVFHMTPKIAKQITEALQKGINAFPYHITRGASQSTLVDSLRPYNSGQIIETCFEFFEIGKKLCKSPQALSEREKEERRKGTLPWLYVRITGLLLTRLDDQREGEWVFIAKVLRDEEDEHINKIIVGRFHAGFRVGGFDFVK